MWDDRARRIEVHANALTSGSVPQEAVDQVRATISGETLTPVDAAYNMVRQVHNGMIDKRPAVIVRCQNTADIADAVKFAESIDLEISSAAVATTWRGACCDRRWPHDRHPDHEGRSCRPGRS